MIEEYVISPKDLRKKFQKWFGNPIPADPPIIAEANHTIGDLVSADPLYPSRVDNFQKLLGILILGFRGAIYLGTIVGIIIFMMNISFWGWYSDRWPGQISVILWAAVIGFYFGMIKGCISRVRER